MEAPHIYIFSHLANALEGQHNVFGNWKCLPSPHCEGQKQLLPGWVINGTNVFAIQAVCRAGVRVQPEAVEMLLL